MLGDGDGCCSCFFVIVVVQCTVVVIRNLDHRFCLINCELIQFLSIGLVACQVEAVISYSVITVTAESYSSCMDLSVVRPSADAVSAAFLGPISNSYVQIFICCIGHFKGC